MSLRGIIEVVKCIKTPQLALQAMKPALDPDERRLKSWHSALAKLFGILAGLVGRHARTMDYRVDWAQVELNQGKLPTADGAFKRIMAEEAVDMVIGCLLVAQCIHQAVLAGDLDMSFESEQLLDLSNPAALPVTMLFITHRRHHHEVLCSCGVQHTTDRPQVSGVELG